jgi:hypothetical protein
MAFQNVIKSSMGNSLLSEIMYKYINEN